MRCKFLIHFIRLKEKHICYFPRHFIIQRNLRNHRCFMKWKIDMWMEMIRTRGYVINNTNNNHFRAWFYFEIMISSAWVELALKCHYIILCCSLFCEGGRKPLYFPSLKRDFKVLFNFNEATAHAFPCENIKDSFQYLIIYLWTWEFNWTWFFVYILWFPHASIQFRL